MHRRRRIATVAAAAGTLATLLPWAADALDVSHAGVHSDLWITLALFALIAAKSVGSTPRSEVPRRTRALLAVGSLCAVLVAALNLPDVREAARGTGLLASYAAAHAACYAVAAVAGAMVALAMLWPPLTPR